MFEAFKPLVIAVELKQDAPHPRSPGSASEDDDSVVTAAATIGRGDRLVMRRMLAGFISGPIAAAAAKKSLHLQREAGTFITHSDVPAAKPSLSLPPPSSASSHAHLQTHITSQILSFCSSLSPAPPPSPYPLLTATIARMQLLHTVPVITCAPRPLLHAILSAVVALCDAHVTEKCGFGAESYELAGNWGDKGAGGGSQMVFPVKMLLCCKDSGVMQPMTAIVACFMEGWLSSAVHGNRRFVSVYVDAAALGDDVGCMDVLECAVVQVRVLERVALCIFIDSCLIPNLQLHAAIAQRWGGEACSTIDWRDVAVLDATSPQALRSCLLKSCNILLQTLDVARIIITINAADRVQPRNDIWLPQLLPRACSVVVSCNDEWGAFACCMLSSGMPNSSIALVPNSAATPDPATLAALVVRVADGLMTAVPPTNCYVFTRAQVVDGRITSAEAAQSRFDVRSINQRVAVDVAATAAFGDACGLRWEKEEAGGGVQVGVAEVRVAVGGGEGAVGQWRMIVLQCIGGEAMNKVAGMDAGQLQMWLLEHFCRPHPLPWRVVARIMLYLCISIDGLSSPLLLDLILLDHARETLSLPPTIRTYFVPLCRAALPVLIHACVRVRIVCASQRSGVWGVLWRLTAADSLLPLLEVAAGVKTVDARESMLQYFEGSGTRFVGRLKHVFHDQSSGVAPSVVDTDDSAADAVAAATPPLSSTPSTAVRNPSPPPFNLRRMREGSHAALVLGAILSIKTMCAVFVLIASVLSGDAARAIAFVLPHVRDGFAAGLGGWVRLVLEMVVRSVRNGGGCGGDGQVALQWWMFVNSNFPAISRGANAFVAAARQWDVHGAVYESVCGRRVDGLGFGTDGGGMKAVAAAAAAAASSAAAAVAEASAAAAAIGGMGGAYFHNPFRHTFPTVSYHQRCRFSFDRGASRVSTVRCAYILETALGFSHIVLSGDGRLVFDVEDECIRCRDLLLLREVNTTRLWLPRLVRIASAAANCNGSIVFIVAISKSDASSSHATAAPNRTSPEHSPGGSPGGSGVNAIDVYSLSIVAITTTPPPDASSSYPSPSSSSVAAAERGLSAMNAQLMQVQRHLATLERRRHALPVTDPQEPRLRREIKSVRERLADLQIAQKLLHRECAAAVGGGDACKVLVEVALDARCAVSMDFNLTIPAACAAASLSDLHLSALAWPEAVRETLLREGVCIYSSDLAVATSAVGNVAAYAHGNVVRVRSSSSSGGGGGSSMPGGSQTIDLPNASLALAMNPAGNLMAAAVTSITGGR